MPRNPKQLIHGSTVSVCFRTEEGLPLTANPCIRYLLKGILAAAQSKYPVTLCHFVIMPNHVHIIFVVEDPENATKFIGYFKRESAHMVNRLMGRRKHTVWCEGYDSPTILDAETAMKEIAYLYINPAEANLETSIDRYPHVSSWDEFLSGGSCKTYSQVPRDCIPELPPGQLDDEVSARVLAELQEQATTEATLAVEPDAWMQTFEESKEADPAVLNAEILAKVRQGEKIQAEKRRSPVIGAQALIRQEIRRRFTPKKWGKRMICLGATKAIRVSFIAWAKQRTNVAKEAFQSLKRGIPARFPPGMFLPGGYLHSNLSPPFSPLPAA
jgi:REP element-mobilizing transposase RayT